MNINQRVQELIYNSNVSQKALSSAISVPTSTLNNWIKLGRSIPSEYIIPICEFFDISTDYLLTGKEDTSSNIKLDSNEQRLLKMYSLLSDIEKGEILGELKAMTKDRMIEKQESNVQTVLIAARSSDHHPPELVTGDFSDIINAPDATDEY